jgi:hypothetical protein
LNKFFSNDPNGDGFCFHETAESAEAAAQNALDQERDAAADDEGWDESVTDICWGEIKQRAVEVERRPSTEEERLSTNHEFFYDYGLVSIN